MKIPELDAVKLMSGLTLEVRLTRKTEYQVRTQLAFYIMRVAIWIANKVAPFRIEEIDE